MKKLLSLVLVLVLASFVNAAIVSEMQIVDNGDGTYSIELVSGMSASVDSSGGYWVLVGVDASSGSLASTLPSAMDLSTIYGDAESSLSNGLFAVGDGVLGEFSASSTTSWTAAAGVYADSFVAQTGVTTLYLYTIDDNTSYATLVDTLVIPEPATIALLCLGGLLLRKKA